MYRNIHKNIFLITESSKNHASSTKYSSKSNWTSLFWKTRDRQVLMSKSVPDIWPWVTWNYQFVSWILESTRLLCFWKYFPSGNAFVTFDSGSFEVISMTKRIILVFRIKIYDFCIQIPDDDRWFAVKKL